MKKNRKNMLLALSLVLSTAVYANSTTYQNQLGSSLEINSIDLVAIIAKQNSLYPKI
jgi:hypothetical protein